MKDHQFLILASIMLNFAATWILHKEVYILAALDYSLAIMLFFGALHARRKNK